MREWQICALLAATLVAFSGCASNSSTVPLSSSSEKTLAATVPTPAPTGWERWDKEGPRILRATIGGYLHNRILDFQDMFDVGLSFGKWARVEAQYGIGFYGFGAQDCQVWRIGRRTHILDYQATTMSSLPFPVSLILFPAALADKGKLGTIITLGGISYEEEHGIWPNAALQGIPQTIYRARLMGIERDRETKNFTVMGDSFMIGADVHLLVGARAHLMPLQVIDFVTGVLGWDIVGDDIRPFEEK